MCARPSVRHWRRQRSPPLEFRDPAFHGRELDRDRGTGRFEGGGRLEGRRLRVDSARELGFGGRFFSSPRWAASLRRTRVHRVSFFLLPPFPCTLCANSDLRDSLPDIRIYYNGNIGPSRIVHANPDSKHPTEPVSFLPCPSCLSTIFR